MQVAWEPQPKQHLMISCPVEDLLFGGARGGSKALSLDTLLVTPSGWTTMAEVRCGDHVFDEQGIPCTVIGASEIMTGHEVHEVVFSDGSLIKADSGHLWATTTNKERAGLYRRSDTFRAQRRLTRLPRGTGKRPDLAQRNSAMARPQVTPPQWGIRTTEEIRQTLLIERQALNHSVFLARPLVLPGVVLGVDPYILGLWLGDGRANAGSITTADIEVVDALAAAGYAPIRQPSMPYGYGTRGLATALRAIGVMGHKHIPLLYLRGSIPQRLALLCGLMDSDGCIDVRGKCVFSNTNWLLASSAHELILSLGMKATITTSRAMLYGKDCGPCYSIIFYPTLPVFRLQRKLVRQTSLRRITTQRRYIVDVRAIPSEPVRCIAVDSPSHLYLAGATMIPTHNSDGLAGDFLGHRMAYPAHAKGLLIRRTYPELEAIEARCMEFYPATGGRWNQGRRTWFWPQGASLRLRFCENERDASHYQGHSYNWLGADELTQWASARAIDILRATVRSPHGVPCYFRGTGNPGGVGHNWVKRRYIDPAPPMTRFWDEEAKTHRIFIPSTLDDNLILQKNDPQYWQRVTAAAAGRPDLLKAWRFGLWDIVAGGMFDDLWDPKTHIMVPFAIPKLWRVDRSHDWGSSKPFCTLWYAESNGEAVEVAPGIVRTYPRGTLFIIAEDYGCPPGKENEGIGGSPALICGRAKRVEERLGRKALPGPADDPLWDSTRGRAMIDEHIALGFSWLKPSKGPGSRITGWTMIRDRLLRGRQWPMEDPGLFVFNHCREFIRTFPALPRDTKNPDDCDSSAEDHAGDALRLKILSQGAPIQTRRYVA